MKASLQSFVAGIGVLAFAGAALAQDSYYGMPTSGGQSMLPAISYLDSAGTSTVGDTRAHATPMPAASGTSIQTPQPAECLCDSSQTGGPWMTIAPYGWIFGMHGTVGAGRRVQTVNLSVADALDAISDLKGAAELHVEGGYGSFGIIADLMYLKVQPLDGLVRVESESTIAELLGMYRVFDTGGRKAGGVFFDVLAGARYYRFSNSIEGNVFGLLSAERTNSWIDLVVGARVGVQVLDSLGVWVRGDVGGFGLGHSSKQACNIVTGFEYQCCECASVIGGYRWLKIDRSSGVGRDAFLLDVTMSGPFVAFGLRF